MQTCPRGEKVKGTVKKKSKRRRRHFEVVAFLQSNFTMAGFNRFGSGGLGSLYTGLNSLQQPSAVNRRDDRFDNRRNSRDNNFDRRERDFGRRDPSPRRRRYSPDSTHFDTVTQPPYSGLRGNRQDNRGGLGSYSMDDLGRDSFSRNRGQSSSDRDLIRDGHNMRPPNRGDGILGAKPGDLPRDLTPNPSSGFTSQLAQQQQQLMAMVQTQSLLAAIQAQASAATKQGGPGRQPPSLMQGTRMYDNRGRMGDRQNRKRRMSPPRGGQRNMNMSNHRQRRLQQYRGPQGGRSNYQQRRDNDRDRKRVSESSLKSEDNEPVEEPYVEETLDDEEEEDTEETKQEKTTTEEIKEATKSSEAAPNEKSIKSEEAKPENQTGDPEFKSETNLAGQNVNNLVKSLYDTSRRKYVCKVCKIMCTKESCFKQHLYGKRHVKTWLESHGQSFEAEMFKRASEEAARSLASREQPKKPKENEQEKPEESSEEKQGSKEKEESVDVKKEEESSVPASSSEEETTAKVKERDNKEKSPAPESKKTPETAKEDKKISVKVKEEKIPVKEEKFEAKYSCNNRKMALKEGEYITISSITEARVRLKGFDKGVNTKGCEFVKAVSGFNCRLCKTFILSGSDVMRHVEGKKHQAKYRRYISEHPKYESNQVIRNNELSEMLSEREGEEVLLYEVTETEEPKRPYRYGSGEVLEVEVTKYVAVEDEPDDRLLDEQDESHDDLIKEDMDVSASSEKKEDNEDDILNDKDGEDKDLEPSEMDENLLLGDDTLEDKYDPDIGKTIDEPTEEQIETKVTETKEDPNTSVDSSLESQEEEEEEPVEKKTKLTTPAVRRGRRAARGGGGQTRGRGRGRGGKRATRQKALPKQEVPPSEEQNDFMEGYEVIDEVADDE